MRSLIPVALVAVVLLLVAGVVVLVQRNHDLSATADNARASREATQTQYGEALSAIAEIQDSLSTLGVTEATGPVLPGSSTAEGGASMERGREALDRIALLKAGISRTREHIRNLEQRMHASGLRVAGMQHMIDNLKHTLDEREAQVAVLAAQVDSLHTQVGGLTAVVATTRDSITTQSQTIDDQKHELGTIYYVIGTRSELQKEGLVRASGGVLGLGKTLLPTADAATAMYKPLDTDAEQTISIPAPKARVMTAQPASSYSLVPNGNQTQLIIRDPKEFRTVKRLVILSMS